MRKQLLVAILLTAMLAGIADAQSWPERPVRLIVAFGAGGTTDVVARIVAARLSEVFQQQFIVENRPGATGVIGAEYVARAPADGYSLLVGTAPQLAIAPLMAKTPYDPLKDFTPISNLAATPFALVVHRGLPVSTLGEFVDFVRKNPGRLSYAVTGFGSVSHLTMMLLLKRAGLDMVPVAYKGGASGLTDVIAGHVQAHLTGVAVALPHAATNEVKLLAVTSERRLPQLPHVPTLAESGFPDLKVLLWTGLLAPAATPPSIIDRIAVETERALRDPSVAERLAGSGVDPLGSTPEQFAATIDRDIAFWRDAIAITGIREK